MRVSFTASHVTGDFSGGWLTIGISIEDDIAGQTVWDEIEFSVPPDFHAHNDCVGAALMTLVGTRYSEVRFNFPISAACAETLSRFYVDVEIGPIDPSLEPRRPGRRIGLNFSGGLDSTATLHLLRVVAGDDLAVITSAYGGFYAFEEVGYSQYLRDVTCSTNLRRRRLDRSGRFNCAVPLLFADYLGLGYFTTGHTVNQTGHGLDRLMPGEQPGFIDQDLVVNAAGITELHVVRSLHNSGLSKILFTLAPQRIEPAVVAVGPPSGAKYYTKARLLAYLYEDAGLPLPDYLRDLVLTAERIPFGFELGMDLRLLLFAKRDGFAHVRRLCPGIGRRNLSFVSNLSFDFLNRYHPGVVALLPPDLREKTLAVFERCGIAPYDELDWREIAVIRRFLESAGVRYLRPAG